MEFPFTKLFIHYFSQEIYKNVKTSPSAVFRAHIRRYVRSWLGSISKILLQRELQKIEAFHAEP